MGDGLSVAAGGWRLTATVGYFNVIANSWHLPAIHGEFGLLGRPIESWELRLLESRHPTDHSYVVDVEGWQTEFRVSRGFRAGVVVSLRVPWIEIGTPHWDGVASTTHGVLGAVDIGSWTARGGTAVYARGDLGVVDRTSGLAQSGWGDATLAVSGALGKLLSGRHRWGVALEAPTGARDSLMGSGGWDVCGSCTPNTFGNSVPRGRCAGRFTVRRRRWRTSPTRSSANPPCPSKSVSEPRCRGNHGSPSASARTPGTRGR
jgi:hypothetical protein